MELSQQRSFRVDEISAIGQSRRYALALAAALDFGETAAGNVAIVVTEAATNILKHAGSGELLLRPLRDARGHSIEILALDRGPGIQDIAASMRDGTSTTGTSGSGLGAMRRLATEFDVYTAPNKGSVFYLLVCANTVSSNTAPCLGVVSQPLSGETVCGDGWVMVAHDEQVVLAVADGLGHGPDAATAARAVLALARDTKQSAPAQLLQLAHQRARATRGAAAAFAEFSGTRIRFAGVGNIAASLSDSDGRRQLISHNGIVGNNLRKVQELSFELAGPVLLIMHSDGLTTHWDLGLYPGLSARHPALIAAVLYRDFMRGTDDTTVLVVRYIPAQPISAQHSR
jgi:anti-sigma regulatory factor (Ser/Thr protein kinase)